MDRNSQKKSSLYTIWINKDFKLLIDTFFLSERVRVLITSFFIVTFLLKFHPWLGPWIWLIRLFLPLWLGLLSLCWISRSNILFLRNFGDKSPQWLLGIYRNNAINFFRVTSNYRKEIFYVHKASNFKEYQCLFIQ